MSASSFSGERRFSYAKASASVPMTRELIVGIFVVRAWHDDDHQFRARVTWSVDVGARPATQFATADADELVAHLRRWLAEMAAGGDTQS
jgi:hypothetical protein